MPCTIPAEGPDLRQRYAESPSSAVVVAAGDLRGAPASAASSSVRRGRQPARVGRQNCDPAHEHDFRKVMERKDVDIVICATVDHWHTLVALAALRAGKDVYCEKPLTLTVDEGKHLVAAQKKTKRILQTGSQQRSDKNFRLACELVRNGRLGKIKEVDVWLPAGRREGPFKTAEVPKNLDWDMWQGPTPQVEYVPQRTHVTFRYWWEYSGGTITDWGAHHNDIVLWGLGHAGPVKVSGKPLVDMIPNGFTAAREYEIEYAYADGVVHRCRSTKANAWNGAVVDAKGQQHGVSSMGRTGGSS